MKQFFLHYERANATSDVPAIGSLYGDTFLFAGPKGVQAVKKEDFLKVVPKMKAHFAALGLGETELRSVEANSLDSKYLLAKVGWRIKFQNPSGSEHVDASATYVLMRGQEDALTIVLQIDHQDLASVVQSQQARQ